jgi:hypothetical protein
MRAFARVQPPGGTIRRAARAAVLALCAAAVAAVSAVDFRSSLGMEDVEEELSPVALGGDRFTLVVHKKRLVWPKEAQHEYDPDDDETAESFDVKDAEGNVLYSYRVLDEPREIELSRVRGQGRFSFSYSVRAHLVRGSASEALMIDWYFFPSAPSACSTHLLLGVVGGRLVPFGEPFCETLVPPRDATSGVWKLEREERTGDDILEVRRWTGYFSLLVPVRVDFAAGKLLPSRRCLRMIEPGQWAELCEFPVEAEREPAAEDTFVRLFRAPESNLTPRHVVVKPDSGVELLSALGPNVFDAHGKWRPPPEGDLPWLRVRIDGREGWVRGVEDLLALGLQPAG